MDKYSDKNPFKLFLGRFFPKDFFEKKSKIYFNKTLMRRWRFVKGQKILDAGCGYGEFMDLCPKNKDVSGIDLNVSAQDKIKQADLNKKIPFSKESYDTVTMFHVLEHLTNPQQALKEVKRVLKNKGRIVVVVPSLSLDKFFYDPTHIRPYPRPALHNILSLNGFKKIRIFNGAYYGKLTKFLFAFPKLRHGLDNFLGNFFPYELIAIAEK